MSEMFFCADNPAVCAGQNCTHMTAVHDVSSRWGLVGCNMTKGDTALFVRSCHACYLDSPDELAAGGGYVVQPVWRMQQVTFSPTCGVAAYMSFTAVVGSTYSSKHNPTHWRHV